MRFGMLKEHAELIGKTKAFDGATLFIPHRLPKPVSFDIVNLQLPHYMSIPSIYLVYENRFILKKMGNLTKLPIILCE